MSDKQVDAKTGSIASLIGIAVPSGFIFSVTYDWGFFHGLGFSPSVSHMTISDHFETGLIWFPPVVVVLVLIWALEFQTRRMERGFTEDQIIETSSNPKFTIWFRQSPYILLRPIVVLAALLSVFFGNSEALGLWSFVWIMFAEWCYAAPLIKLRRSAAVQAAFSYIPAIGILAYAIGFNDAYHIREGTHSNTSTTRIETQKSSFEGSIVRSVEKGISMIVDGRIIFIPWPQIVLIEGGEVPDSWPGLLCAYFIECSE